jgi:uncharacterized protein YjlB
VPTIQCCRRSLYRSAIPCPTTDPGAAFERAFRSNGWPPEWRNGVYPFPHYHSTAHEVLGFAAGTARLLLGGLNGREALVTPGDCFLLPQVQGIAASNPAPTFSWSAPIRPVSSGNSVGAQLRNRLGRRCWRGLSPDPVLGHDGPLLTHWRPS